MKKAWTYFKLFIAGRKILKRVGGLTLFEALTGWAFDRLNWQQCGEFDQNFSKKSNVSGFAPGGGGGGVWVVLELTGTLDQQNKRPT